MTINQVTKFPHIVPQRHLKNFLIPGSTKLECFNIDAVRLERPQSPKSICKGFFHYAIEPGREDEYSQIVEKAFGDIEDWYGKNIDRIKKLLIFKQKLSDDDKFGVSWVIANFYFRGYKFRQEIAGRLNELTNWMQPTISEHIHKQCIKSYPQIFSGNEEEKDLLQEITKQSFSPYVNNTSYATSRAFDESFANTLTHKKWRILINNSTEYPFITGDEAVIQIIDDQIPKNIFSQSFLHLTQIFHLSPKIAIIVSCPFNEAEHGQIIFEDVTDNKVEIYKSNLFYINHTYRYAYGPNKTFFEAWIALEKYKKE